MSKKRRNAIEEKSTVFCDPTMNREEPKSPGKTLKKVIIAVLVFVLVFAIIPFMTVKIINVIKADQKRAEIPSLWEAVEQTKADDQAKELFSLKTSEELDEDSVAEILDVLLLEENAGEYGIFCSQNKITLKFKAAPDKSREDWFENTMVKYSCALMSLISSADEVAWEYSGIDKTHSFKRNEVREFLGYNASDFAASAETVQVMLNRLGLNEY